MDYNKIIDKFYPEANRLRDILITHSTMVMKRAVKICDAHPELNINREFVVEAAMLHDIGICRCDAPGIECFGTEPYILHGRIGAEMLRAEGFPEHARVCERHTGTGKDVPAPVCGAAFLEEQVICYADKFYSKTHPEREKSYEQAMKSLAKFGEAGLVRFAKWKAMFE